MNEEPEEDINGEYVINDEEESEEESSIMKNNQPIDINTALSLRNTIEEERIRELNNMVNKIYLIIKYN